MALPLVGSVLALNWQLYSDAAATVPLDTSDAYACEDGCYYMLHGLGTHDPLFEAGLANMSVGQQARIADSQGRIYAVHLIAAGTQHCESFVPKLPAERLLWAGQMRSLGNAAFAARNISRARIIYQRALQALGQTQLAPLTGALASVEAAAETTGDDDADEDGRAAEPDLAATLALNLAACLVHSAHDDDADDAVRCCEFVLSRDSACAKAWFRLAQAHAIRARLDEARQALQRADALSPGDPAIARELQSVARRAALQTAAERALAQAAILRQHEA